MFEESLTFNSQHHHTVVQSASEAQVGAHSPASPNELLRMQKIVVRSIFQLPLRFFVQQSADSFLKAPVPMFYNTLFEV